MGGRRQEFEETQAASTVGPIESVCERFETAFAAGKHPVLEELLSEWEEPERSKLLSELLLIELDHASESGETVVPQLYETRFPEHSNVIRDVFDRWMGRQKDTVVGGEDTLVMQSQFGRMRAHAKGGLGIVFRADDRRLKRGVAVKFIRSKYSRDTASRDRFRQEAEITSRLEHPGIVPVYGMGETGEGKLFYAMRFIQGQTMDELIERFHKEHKHGSPENRERRFRELLERFIAVCKTMAYSHNRGIVHRDIKPENVMLGRYGETIVIDWGLAMPVGRRGVFKDSEELTLLPSSGGSSGESWGGTPAYMSPEQAAGTIDLTPASDIYSLGVTLYKILTGKVPFKGSLHDLRSKVIRGDFKKPSERNRDVSRSVEAICLKAMALSPGSRYETALALAEDIDNYLADAPVNAYEEPFSLRLARWGRRHRALSQSMLMGLVLLTVAGMTTSAVVNNWRSHAETARNSEHEMRKHSLAVSARFAARTIADKIDIRLRILEAVASDPQLQALIKPLVADPASESLRKPLQEWFDAARAMHGHIEDRSWFICVADGWQVARYPQFQDTGEPFESLQNNYGYRDYFHGRLSDFETGPPIQQPHVSIAMESTNGGDLIVVLSTPIKASAEDDPLGVIGMSIELGQFADLNIPLPTGQKVILVDTRRYFMKLKDSAAKGPSGEGLLLHHPDLTGIASPDDLPHLTKPIVKQMRAISENGPTTDNLLSADYRDPISDSAADAPLAAYAPVVLTARPPEADVYHTGWFVIIQQQ